MKLAGVTRGRIDFALTAAGEHILVKALFRTDATQSLLAANQLADLLKQRVAVRFGYIIGKPPCAIPAVGT